MRDPTLYTAEKCWTADESNVADRILEALRANRSMSYDDVLASFCAEQAAAHAGVDIMHVARKMEEFPHIFEVAKARNELDNYDLSGVYREGGKHAFTHVSFQNWTVPVREVESFIRSGSLTPAMLELLNKPLRPYPPSGTVLRPVTDLRSNRCSLDYLRNKKVQPAVQLLPYQSNSTAWALFVLTHDAAGTPLQRILPEKYIEKAFEYVTKTLTKTYAIQTVTTTTWYSSHGLDMLYLNELARFTCGATAAATVETNAWCLHVQDVIQRVLAACIAEEEPEIEELSLIHI